MIQLISNRITDKLIENRTIVNEDRELYVYGLQQGFIMLINIMTTIIIGVIFGMFWQSIVFLIAYIPIRSYAGGYHARTQLRCYFISTIIIIMALLGMRMVMWTNFYCLLTAFLSSIIIIILAPVEDTNKPLSQKEKQVYRKKTIIILGVLFNSIILFLVLDQFQISVSITMAILVLGFMVVFGNVRNVVAI
jgi:accessory gene regulator B